MPGGLDTTKLKMLSAVGFIVGFGLLGTCAFWEPILDAVSSNLARSNAILSEVNKEKWQNIPGHNDSAIYHDHSFYHCRNPEEVIFKGV